MGTKQNTRTQPGYDEDDAFWYQNEQRQQDNDANWQAADQSLKPSNAKLQGSLSRAMNNSAEDMEFYGVSSTAKPIQKGR
jgi:hypothetical protein